MQTTPWALRVGDEVIVEIGRRIEASLRSEDTVSRPQDRAALKNAILFRWRP